MSKLKISTAKKEKTEIFLSLMFIPMNYSRLKSLAKTKRITIKRLIEENTDMSEAGFYQAIKNNSLTVRVLEAIAKALDVPISCFFDESPENSVLSPEDDIRNLQTEIIRLQRELIEEKERNIKLVEKLLSKDQ